MFLLVVSTIRTNEYAYAIRITVCFKVMTYTYYVCNENSTPQNLPSRSWYASPVTYNTTYNPVKKLRHVQSRIK